MKVSEKSTTLLAPVDPVDPEMAEFEAALLRSLGQVQRGEYGRVSTPAQIAVRKKIGRPTGSVQAEHKQPVTLRLDAPTLAAWRASGKGWQTRAAKVLHDWMKEHTPA